MHTANFIKQKEIKKDTWKIQFLQNICSENAILENKGTEDQLCPCLSFKGGQPGKLFSQIIQPCPPDLPMFDYFYFLDIW